MLGEVELVKEKGVLREGREGGGGFAGRDGVWDGGGDRNQVFHTLHLPLYQEHEHFILPLVSKSPTL